MRLDHHPYFRKVFIPWYDSDNVCFVNIVLMVIVLLFSLSGVMVSIENNEFKQYIWLPLLLMALSFVVIVSTSLRLMHRSSGQQEDR